MFANGHVLIRVEGAALDAAVRLDIKQGLMYRVLGQPVGGSREILDQRSMLKKVSWYDLTLMAEWKNTSDQSAIEVVGGSSGSEGATTTTTSDFIEVVGGSSGLEGATTTTTSYFIGSKIDPGGDTSLSKREC